MASRKRGRNSAPQEMPRQVWNFFRSTSDGRAASPFEYHAQVTPLLEVVGLL